MTDQLNLNPQNTALNWTKFWLYSKLFLSLLITVTLLSFIATMPSLFFVYKLAIAVLCVVMIVLLKFKRKPIHFVKIEANKLQYFCPVKKELVVIQVNEITNITTRFCELQIHTTNRTHCLNLNHLKQEKQRWEIKEMIRKLAVENCNHSTVANHVKAS